MQVYDENKPLILLVTYIIPSKKRAEFLDTLKSEGLLDTIHAEAGCLQYEYFFPEEDESRLLLVEQWASRSLWDEHMSAPHLAQVAAIKERMGIRSQLKILQEC